LGGFRSLGGMVFPPPKLPLYLLSKKAPPVRSFMCLHTTASMSFFPVPFAAFSLFFICGTFTFCFVVTTYDCYLSAKFSSCPTNFFEPLLTTPNSSYFLEMCAPLSQAFTIVADSVPSTGIHPRTLYFLLDHESQRIRFPAFFFTPPGSHAFRRVRPGQPRLFTLLRYHSANLAPFLLFDRCCSIKYSDP